MLNLENKTTELIQLIEEAVHHPYLLNYIDKPEIDKVKLSLILELFTKSDLPEKKKKDTILAAMLVQIALDTHERVSLSVSVREDPMELKSRQLTILAGDYFSGLYYSILAGIGEVSFIKYLSGGIKDINEHKIMLYQADFHQPGELLKTLEMIESGILLQAADALGESSTKAFLSKILLCKRLIEEKKLCLQDEGSYALQHLETLLGASGSGNKAEKADIIKFLDSTTASIIQELHSSSFDIEAKKDFISKLEQRAK
ncbi:heptaprenyl diphosphate synthase component 1 [Peribacillus kribbensis]|uniref:heptaprenyl diphosphate synthase component 1 n=1 Tax=Peribacillus kribbensis TaxID=356658 RepID=UPI00040A9A0D|nr:heptaprenyl diphosphate synthase component 1 [Peribacillus kribbensis]